MSTIGRVDEGAGELRALLAERAVLPGQPDWDDARRPWNLSADQHPLAVVYPEDAAEAAAVVAVARKQGWRVAPQGTGHQATALDGLDGSVLVRTSRMTRVDIDPVAARVRVDAGVVWQDVTVPAAEHGLAALAGSAPDVGVVGYSLGGGIGWLARRYGFAANSLLAVELVTADGRQLRTDRDHEPELFWALRGGGGGFGLVTALEFRLYPVHTVYAGALFWPSERFGEVLERWRDWAMEVPDTVTTVARLLQFPPLPALPEPLRGRAFAIVEAACLDDEPAAEDRLAPLRAMGPDMDTFASIPAPALGQLHMDPPEPVAGVTDHCLLDALPTEAVSALTVVAGPGSGSPLLSVEIRRLGGALATRSPEHGALDAIDAPFLMFGVGLGMDPQGAAAAQRHLAAVRTAMAPWAAPQRVLNFTDAPGDPRAPFDAHTMQRMQAVKEAYDPTDLFLATHPVRVGG